MPNFSLSKTFAEYKKSLGQGASPASGFPQTYDKYVAGLSDSRMKSLYTFARQTYTSGVPKTYADFLDAVHTQMPQEVSSRLTREAVHQAAAKLGMGKPQQITPEQAKESLKVQGALLTEMPEQQDMETPTGAPRVAPTEINTGLVGLTPEGDLPQPTITSGLSSVLPQQVQVPKEGAFALEEQTIPSPTLKQPTAMGSKVTRKGEEPSSPDEPTVAGRFGAALLRGTGATLDAIGGWVETLANFGVAQAELEQKVYGALGSDTAALIASPLIGADTASKLSSVFSTAEKRASSELSKATSEGNYLDLTGAQDYVKSLVGDTRINDTSIKNPLVKATLSGIEQFVETIPDLALIVGTGSPQSAARLGAEITPEVADFMYKYAPKAQNVATRAVGKLLGDATVTPNTLKALQVDWVQPFKAAAKSDFAVWLGSKEASNTMQESPEDTIGSVGEGIKAFGTGYASGLFFEKLGITPVKLSSAIAVKTGTPIAGLATNMVGTAGVGFGGDILMQASDQVSRGEDVHPDYYQAVAAAVGFAGATALHGRSIIANTRAGIRAEQWRNLYEMENKTIDYCLNKSYDASTLNAKLDNVTQQKDNLLQVMDRNMDKNGNYRKNDVAQLRAMDAQANAYRQVLITQSFTKEIIQNPEKFKTEIRDNDNLKPEVKEQLMAKIDGVVWQFDPINVESRRLSDKVDNLNFQITQLPVEDPMTPKKQAILAKQVSEAQDRMASLELNPTYYYKGEFYDTHGALIDALNKRYTEGTSSEVIVRNDANGEKLVNEALNQMLDRKFNEGMKAMQKQAVAKVEAAPLKDQTILENQKRLNLPADPEMLVSQNALKELDKATSGEAADITMMQHASDQLYGEAKRLESMKDSDSRQFTIEQIENAQKQAYEDIAFAENYIQAKKAGEAVDVAQLQTEAKGTAEEAINDIRSRRQLLLPDEVKAKLNAPKPEVQVETPKPVEDATKEGIIQQDGIQQREQVSPRGVSTEAGRGDIPVEGRKVTPEEKEVTTWEELPVEQYVVLGEKGEPMVAGKERRAAISRQEKSVRETLLAEHKKSMEERETSMRSGLVEERLTDWRKQNPDATEAEMDTQKSKFAEEAQKATVAKAGGTLTDADIMLGARLATSYMREGIKKTADLFKEVSDNIKGALGVELSKKDFDRMMKTSLEEYGKSPRELSKELYSTAAKSATKRQIEEITGIKRKPEMALMDVLRETRARYKEQEKVATDAVKVGVKEGKLQAKEAAFDKEGYRDQLNQFLKENKELIREVNPELTPALARSIAKVDSWYTLDKALGQIKKAISSKEYATKLAERATQISKVEKNLSHEGKSKFGTAQQEVSDFLKVDRDALSADLKPEYDKLLQDLSARSAEVPYDPFQLNRFLENAKAQVDEGYAAYRERQIEKAIKKEIASRSDYAQLEANEKDVIRRDVYSTLVKKSIDTLPKRTGVLTVEDKIVNDFLKFTKEELMELPASTLTKIPLMVAKIAAGVTPARLYSDVVRPTRSYKKGTTIMRAHGQEVLPLLAELDLKVDGVREQLEVDMAKTGLSNFDKWRLKDALLMKPRYLLDSMFKGAQEAGKSFYDTVLFDTASNKTKAEADAAKYKINNSHLWDKAYRARSKAGKGDRFDSAFLSTMYMKSIEYEANKGILGAHSPYDYFKNLVDFKASYGVYNENNSIRMRELWKDIQDKEGNVTPESVDKLLIPEERAAIKYMRDWYSTEGLDKTRISEIIYRGGALQTYNDYSHNFVVSGNNVVDPAEFVDQVFGGTPKSNMSLRSATTHARSGQTGTISIDPVATFNRAVDSTYYDYHLTPAIQETLGAFKVMQDMATDKKWRDSLLAIEKAYRDDVTVAFENTMRQTTNLDKVMNAMGGAFYSGALASMRRIPQELVSNFSSAIIYDPVSYHEGAKAVFKHHKDSLGTMDVFKSGYEGLFDFAGVSNRFRKSVEDFSRMFNDTDMAAGTIRTGLLDKAVDIMTKNKVKSTFDVVNKSVVSINDDIVGTRFFIGKFIREYRKLSGEDFDIKRFNSEETYKFDNEQNIMAAAKEASYHTNLMTNTANTMEGIQALKVRRPSAMQFFKDINNTLAGFSMHEASVMTTSLRSLTGNGALSARQAWALFAAVTTRNILYNTVLEFGARAAWAGLDDNYTVANAAYDVFSPDQLARQTLGAWIQIGIGSRGNLLRLPLQFGVSRANQWVTEQWLGKEFDPEKHKLGNEGPDMTQVCSIYKAVKQLGPYQIPIDLGYRGIKVAKTLSNDSDSAEVWASLGGMFWGTQKALLPLPFQRDMEGMMKQGMEIINQDGNLKDLFTADPISKAIVGVERTERIQEQMDQVE